ncbi:sugar ABC transporter permease [Mesomycoplasma neurolyticum]|uniref:Uncharacterized protein n=1 Tax=Mesomycoplasma neurolyticum TaxID=2120 RepID=A0A449A4N8_9BACT|nr:sugar ABC transporter permease [Mesomycoplasma neurolyticum]VEU59199.1 Uncharacterised protein [Mesomycoplasma neurolyticum]
MKKIHKKHLMSILFILPFIIFIILFYIYPFYFSLKNAFIFPDNEYKETNFIFGIKNFSLVLKDKDFWIAFNNSNFLFFLGLPISILISLIFAFLLNSLLSKIFKKIFINIIYSQFFISIFAIGISFTLLFGEKNVFFKMFNIEYNVINNKNVWVFKFYLLFFTVWKSLSFNIVFLSFIFAFLDNKYNKQIGLDKLKFKDKFIYLYFLENKKMFFILLYSNITFTFLIYPGILLENEADILKINGHTFSSYILNLLNPLDNSIYFDYNKAFAASIIVILYLFLIIVISILFYWIIKILYLKINKIKESKYVCI